MNKNFIDEHNKVITLLVATAALIYLGVAGFRFMHSYTIAPRIQTSSKGVILQSDNA